ncbi:MAG: hypothetical protein GC134_04480 [Proteobacteria bacterium]|nr:hypothetical protein [Pseudomonadota bacterium]
MTKLTHFIFSAVIGLAALMNALPARAEIVENDEDLPPYSLRLAQAKIIYPKVCEVAREFKDEYHTFDENIVPVCDMLDKKNTLFDKEAYNSLEQICAVNFTLGMYLAIQEYAEARADGLISNDMSDYLALAVALNTNYAIAYADALKMFM